jgi:hypothetical protein
MGVSLIGTPIAGWFILWKIPRKMDDLGVPLFPENMNGKFGKHKKIFEWVV